MKKIVSLFERNHDGDRLVRDQIVPGAEWVAAGEGVATIKWDGTAVMMRNSILYKRYDAKHGKTPPSGFLPAQDAPDDITGHWPGWLKVTSADPSNKWLITAYAELVDLPDWTYEFCGPHVQGNPHRLPTDRFIRHGADSLSDVPRGYDAIFWYLGQSPIEGLVWWRNREDVDCDKVKIKRRDFGLYWPIKEAQEAS